MFITKRATGWLAAGLTVVAAGIALGSPAQAVVPPPPRVTCTSTAGSYDCELVSPVYLAESWRVTGALTVNQDVDSVIGQCAPGSRVGATATYYDTNGSQRAASGSVVCR